MNKTLTTLAAVTLAALTLNACGTEQPADAAQKAPAVTEAPATTAAPAVAPAPTQAPTTPVTVPPATEAPTTTVKRVCTDGITRGSYDTKQTCVSNGWRNTPEPRPTTTTVAPDINADANVLVLGAGLNNDPAGFGKILSDADSSIETVDVVHFDVTNGPPPTSTLTIAVTTGYHGIEYRDSTAWTLAKILSVLWNPVTTDDESSFRNEVGSLHTELVIVVDDTTYVAPMELMMQAADLTVTSMDFLNATRR